MSVAQLFYLSLFPLFPLSLSISRIERRRVRARDGALPCGWRRRQATTRQVDIDCIHGTTSSKRAAGKDKAAMPECHASPPPANYFKNKADYNAAAASASAGAINYK
uniref:Uncharacterized protein n=1 Tax=Oryza meridionalis TaxID=40149 RepID=A0A0E0EDI3_9ORYZ